MLVLADDLESMLPKLALDHHQRHLMRVIQVSCARTPINNYQASARPKRLTDPIQYRFRIAELVVGVGDQHRVHTTYWQARIVSFSDHDVNVMVTAQQRPRPQEEERQFPKIHGKNLSSFADLGRQLEREVASARAKIDYSVSFLQIQCMKNV